MTSGATALEPVSFGDIAGWTDDDLSQAFAPFQRSCRQHLADGRAFERPVVYGGTRDRWLEVCKAAANTEDPRHLFETWFQPFRVSSGVGEQGLFTGYYEPEVAGSLVRSAEFSVPLYRKPGDLETFSEGVRTKTGLAYGRRVAGEPRPYFSRREIEQGALADRGLEFVWLRDWADAFFLQVQGSGRIRLQNGSVLRVGYAAKSGRPYTSIGAKLADDGIIARELISMQSIRKWMAENPAQARKLMWENESFVFFRELQLQDDELGPTGAGRVQLTPGRSLAVDRGIWMFGTPMWLDTSVPSPGRDRAEPFRKLVIAQDTGSAIKGLVRGDVFWGTGDGAAEVAGKMKSAGSVIVLLPIGVATDLGLLP